MLNPNEIRETLDRFLGLEAVCIDEIRALGKMIDDLTCHQSFKQCLVDRMNCLKIRHNV